MFHQNSYYMKTQFRFAVFFLGFVVANFSVLGQIPEYSAPHNTIDKNTVFDSTHNIPLLEEDYPLLTGQTLYVKYPFADMEQFGYHGFYQSWPKQKNNGYNWDLKTYGKNPKAYSCTSIELQGKYFKVEEVKHYTNGHYWLKLVNVNNSSDIAYYEVYGVNEYEFRNRFIVLSHFNFTSSLYKDKVICLIENNSVVRKNCISVGIDKDVQVLCLVFEDGTSTFVANDLIRFNNYNDDFWEEMNLGASSRAKDRYNWFMTEESYDKLYEKYGDYVVTALERKVRVGMPLELLLISWGEPEKINRSSYGPDQYVYGGQYVYVEDGKITSWN